MPNLTLLFFGDIVGRPGRQAVCHALPLLKKRHDPDLVIANAENSAGGSGLTPSTFQKIISYGVDVCTSGDHIFRNKEFPGVIHDSRVLRPANFPQAAAGKGWGIFDARGGVPVAVLNLMGRIFIKEPLGCPFQAADEALAELKERPNPPKVIFVDLHAEATSEKMAMGWHLDGRVSALIGTHTHVPTADERILPGGTAYLSDAGMSGPYDSVIGRDKEKVLQKFRTGMPARFDVAKDGVKACGAVVRVDTATGHAQSIERFQVGLEDVKLLP